MSTLISGLKTTRKDSLVAAVNEVKSEIDRKVTVSATAPTSPKNGDIWIKV